ncbi:MAG: glycosyltransferase [Bacteroidota bacterium]
MSKSLKKRIPTLVMIAGEEDLQRERKGYFHAFSRIGEVVCFPGAPTPIMPFLAQLEADGRAVLGVLYPDSYWTPLPPDFMEIPYPTMCFLIDSYDGIQERARFARLFDMVAVFHPGHDKIYQKAGLKNCFVLPHAVEAEIFPHQPAQARKFDIGWVGRLDGPFYQTRRRLVRRLEAEFVTNEIDRNYNQQELIEIYGQSKIIVNISRDDYLEDANLRCFEGLASGGLLMTCLPTELDGCGLKDQVHFVGFQEENQLIKLVRQYLEDEESRLKIATQGHTTCQEAHTYVHRAKVVWEKFVAFDLAQRPARNQAGISQLFSHYMHHRRYRLASGMQKSMIKTSIRHLGLMAKEWIRVGYRELKYHFT